MTDIEHAKKYAEESISLAISMYNPKAEIIAETACLYGLTFKNERITELEKENAELKADNDARKFAMTMSEKVEKQLRNERNTFLAQNEQYEKDLIDLKENLTKAKDIIRALLKHTYGQNLKTQNDFDLYLGRIKEAKQFLSEVEK